MKGMERNRGLAATLLMTLLGSCGDPDTWTPKSPVEVPGETAPAAEPGAIESAETPDAAALFARAQDFLRANKVIRAIGLLDQAITADDSVSRYHLVLGKALLQESADQDFEEAAQSFARATALGAGKARVWQAKARMNQDRHDDADQLLQTYESDTAARNEPIDAWCFLMQAQIQLARKQLEDAGSLLTKSRELTQDLLPRAGALGPDTAFLVQTIAKELERTQIELTMVEEDWPRALELARSQVERYPERSDRRRLLARTLRGTGDDQEATRQDRAAELLDEIESKLFRTSVTADELEAMFQELDTIPPRSPRLPLRLARAYLHRNEFQQVVDLCVKTRTELGTDGPARRLVAEAWFLEGEINLKAAKGLLPGHPRVRPHLEAAKTAFGYALQLAPPGFEASYRLLTEEIDRRLKWLEE